MQRPKHEVATVIKRFGQQFIVQCNPNSYTIRTLDSLLKCRTSDLGGHKEKCDCCGKERISYNSCRNRHCPKCQGSRQAFWVEDRMEQMLAVKHFHIVFTIPEKLNRICMLDSKWFYNAMFECVWSTLRSFGYTHYGVESGAICVLRTWGENLCLHPHIHCIVPAAGLTLQGTLKRSLMLSNVHSVKPGVCTGWNDCPVSGHRIIQFIKQKNMKHVENQTIIYLSSPAGKYLIVCKQRKTQIM